MAKLYTYLMEHDSGFAPNPFHGVLTLSTCKPGIRNTKKRGDWVAGFSSKKLIHKVNNISNGSGVSGIPLHGLIYVMHVTEILPIEEYFKDQRFQVKKPKTCSSSHVDKFGDNIYYKDNFGKFCQKKNINHGPLDMPDDISGINALISYEFYYFGKNCFIPYNGWDTVKIKIPNRTTPRGFKNEDSGLQYLLCIIQKFGFYEPGLYGDPCLG